MLQRIKKEQYKCENYVREEKVIIHLNLIWSRKTQNFREDHVNYLLNLIKLFKYEDAQSKIHLK